MNLACALQHLGAKVGLLDCDIYGPSIPLMMGVNEKPTISDEEKMVPPANYGVKLMSMGFLVEGDQPVIWRGPMIMKTIQQFFSAVEWGDWTCCWWICRRHGGCPAFALPDGAAGRRGDRDDPAGGLPGRRAQRHRHVPEGERADPRHRGEHELLHHPGRRAGGDLWPWRGSGGGGAPESPFLGEVPMFTEIREGGDRGVPVVVSAPEQPAGQAFIRIAQALRRQWGVPGSELFLC